MAKKRNKKRKVNVPVYAVPTTSQADKKMAQAANTAPKSNPLASKNATTDSIDWAKEYPFYGPDMKRLGIIVALMVILLLALNMIFIYVL